MVLAMARPFKHPKTGVYWFRRVVPKDLREAVGKREFLRSLRTKDPSEARTLHANVAAEVDKHWKALRSPAETLTQKQVIALAGVFYLELTTELSDEPGSPAVWEHWLRIERQARDAGKLEQWLGPAVDPLLARHGLNIDVDSRARLLVAISEASEQAAAQLRRNAEGDYSPDPRASRFPEWKPKEEPKTTKPAGKTSLTGILADWWKEAEKSGRKPSTYESYSNTVDNLVAFLGHDDASQVAAEHVVGFKDHRLASTSPRTGKPISAKTVKDSDLAALKTLFGWAVTNKRLPANPAAGITIKLGKRKRTRPPGFTDQEAKDLLEAADARQKGGEHPKTFAAKRWVPWLCAYTGSRVGEMVQLRKQDVRQEGNLWVIHITPEAGTVKTDEARDVVMHEHLVAKGFPDFVKSCRDSYLFITPKSDGSIRGPWRTRKNDLIEAARETVKDPRVAPNHGWRHRFKTVGMEVGVDHRVLDAIQGQQARTVAETYGDVTLKTRAIAIAKFPRQA